RSGRLCEFNHTSAVGPQTLKFRLMAEEELLPREAARVRKMVQISTMVHPEKDRAFIALCDGGSLWPYHCSGSVATLQEWSDKLGRYGPRTLSCRSVQVAPI